MTPQLTLIVLIGRVEFNLGFSYGTLLYFSDRVHFFDNMLFSVRSRMLDISVTPCTGGMTIQESPKELTLFTKCAFVLSASLKLNRQIKF